MEKRFELIGFGKRLWTRVKAKEIKKDLENLIDEAVVGDIVVIDLKGVEVFDISFANELFIRTAINLHINHPGILILVENIGEFTRENLEMALESGNLALIERFGDKLSLIGKVHPTDQETFKAIAEADKPISSAELKEKLGVNITAINERLKKLVEMGLVRRNNGISPSGREQYMYFIP